MCMMSLKEYLDGQLGELAMTPDFPILRLQTYFSIVALEQMEVLTGDEAASYREKFHAIINSHEWEASILARFKN